MDYTKTYQLLKCIINYKDDLIVVDEKTVVRNYDFISENSEILPGEIDHCCDQHSLNIENKYSFLDRTVPKGDLESQRDSDIEENNHFRYHLFMPPNVEKADQLILLLHGFNEKDWNKYLPWAKHILESTGKAVLLFPIAFHMNRAPSLWSDAREMYKLSSLRKEIFPNVACSSLSNAAISSRLHAKPQRFIWSGLQTYYDIIQLVEQIKKGEHPAISEKAEIDFFAYSIGAFLSQVIMMTNYKNYFNNSKLGIFCGGAIFNRLSPVSKFILDSEANISLYSFLIEHLENQMRKDKQLGHYLSVLHPEGFMLRSMLNYRIMHEERENIFQKISDRILAVVLKKDNVVPPYEVVNALMGRKRDIPVRIEELDFPYPYTHEDPFPIRTKMKKELNESFNSVFGILCNFFNEPTEKDQD